MVVSDSPPPAVDRNRCFFDIAVDTDNLGRVIFELYNDKVPRTCENFRQLCTGEAGLGKNTGKPLHFQVNTDFTIFHSF